MDEEGLVVADDTAADATGIIRAYAQLEPPVVAGELMRETAGLDGLIRRHLVQSLDRAWEQDHIGTEKEQPFSDNLFCTYTSRPKGF